MRRAESGRPNGTEPVALTAAALRPFSAWRPLAVSATLTVRVAPAPRLSPFALPISLAPLRASIEIPALFVTAFTLTFSLPEPRTLFRVWAGIETVIFGRATGVPLWEITKVPFIESGWMLQTNL